MTRFFTLLAACSLVSLSSAIPAAAQKADKAEAVSPPSVGPVTGGPAAVAPPALFNPSGETGVSRPHYIVETTSFKTLNETGWDILGSDEIVVRYLANNQSMFTGVYGSVDTGDTHQFRSLQRCISPAIDPDSSYNHSWQCGPQGTSGPISFAIEFFEYDGFMRGLLTEPMSFCLTPTANDLNIRCDRRLESLVVGRGQATFTEAELAAAMPGPGSQLARMVPIGSNYQVNVVITRTNLGAIAPPEVVVPTPASPISLQAVVDYSTAIRRVALTWSGATTTRVNIYRNGAMFANPLNSGTFSSAENQGTYIFRVCNDGSTTFCSSNVSVTVNP